MQYTPQEPSTWQQSPPMESMPHYQWESLPPSQPLPPDNSPIYQSPRRNVKLIIVGLVVLVLLGLSVLGASAYVISQVAFTPTNQAQVTPGQSTPTLISTATAVSTSTLMSTPAATAHTSGLPTTVTPSTAITPTPLATPGRHKFGSHHHRRKKP